MCSSGPVKVQTSTQMKRYGGTLRDPQHWTEATLCQKWDNDSEIKNNCLLLPKFVPQTDESRMPYN